jgi:hypothetical protein
VNRVDEEPSSSHCDAHRFIQFFNADESSLSLIAPLDLAECWHLSQLPAHLSYLLRRLGAEDDPLSPSWLLDE